MPQGSAGFHEAENRLSEATRDMHRAVVSLMEELEAVDWYQQRVEAASDDQLREILAHNRDEEKEHAAMVLEWIRRRDPGFDEALRTYLFKEGSIVGLESALGGRQDGNGTGPRAPGVGLGSLRGGR
jgi:ferritin-like protein